MMPPECTICDRVFSPGKTGDLVSFAKRDSDIEWDRQIELSGLTGHPPHQAWFCNKHLRLAQRFAHLPIDKAMISIRGQQDNLT